MDDDDGLERGDEQPRWPPMFSPEWYLRQVAADTELRQAAREISSTCADINAAVRKIFRECAT